MLKIKLKRLGHKIKLFYQIVLVNTLCNKNGVKIIKLGYYDPFKKTISLNKSKLYYYIKAGAYPTNSIRHIILKSS
jgi:small subunit ribosomal protein S16